MSENPLFDELISGLDPDDVPPEYIIMAVVTDFNGAEHMFYGEELENIMHGSGRTKYRQARVILDVKRIRSVVMDRINQTFEKLNQMFATAQK